MSACAYNIFQHQPCHEMRRTAANREPDDQALSIICALLRQKNIPAIDNRLSIYSRQTYLIPSRKLGATLPESLLLSPLPALALKRLASDISNSAEFYWTKNISVSNKISIASINVAVAFSFFRRLLPLGLNVNLGEKT